MKSIIVMLFASSILMASAAQAQHGRECKYCVTQYRYGSQQSCVNSHDAINYSPRNGPYQYCDIKEYKDRDGHTNRSCDVQYNCYDGFAINLPTKKYRYVNLSRSCKSALRMAIKTYYHV